ncbi:CDP-glycerol glycerophosphotransferase family protein [Nocardioides sp. Bht2]|uniref:CDP-glycerol glycerophosphotransferase family protein n=1 Tax=Nocardioides sp. Bht2 TaxID=3392297 RepID=UPI0039B5DDED
MSLRGRLRAWSSRLAPGFDAQQLAAVDRFGETPAVAHLLPQWLPRARRLGPVELLTEARAFLIDGEHAAEAEFSALSALLAQALAKLTSQTAAQVAVDDRVRAWLAANGRREELADFVVERAYVGDNVVTHVVGGRILADYGPLHPAGLPEALAEFAAQQSPLELRIRRCRRVGDEAEIELIAVVRVVDFATTPPVFTLTRAGSPVEFSTLGDPAATRFSARRFQSHDAGSLQLRLDLGSDADLEVRVELAGLVRTARLSTERVRARLPKPAVPGAATDARVVGRELIIDGAELTLPLWHEPFGLPARPRPTGPVELPHDVEVAEEFAATLPRTLATDVQLLEFVAEKGRLKVRLLPPLSEDERGRYRQQQLQLVEPPLDRNHVLFSAYAGSGVTDSPAAIFEELRQSRLDLRFSWAVTDHSVPVPAGAEALIVHSRAWHEAWASAHLVVTNVEVQRNFTPRAGQTVVQTFHGYPSKSMGKVLWESKNFSPRKIQYQLDRTSRVWNVLLTPHPSMDRHYREQYEFDGRILNQGYPRDDALVVGAEERRAETRRRLGLRDDQIAVLNAPTWRDNAATDFRSAALADHLDNEQLIEALGERYVVLQRGHRFNVAGTSSSGVIDVTEYPEINDLILAADVAVLDYSSLRFDFAVTGKPMLFLVPDLAEYTQDARGFLYSFTESAPGPLLATTAEVIRELGDLPALRERQQPVIDAFNARFNGFHDGQAAARVVAALEELLGPP